jgi:iron(III) transport system permease protein
MRRALPLLARIAASAVVVVGLVLPLGAMVVASFRSTEVALKDGRVVEAAGAVVETADEVRLHLPPGAEDAPTDAIALPKSAVAEVRERWTLSHYRAIADSPRTPTLLANSLRIAGFSALLAVLLGLPAAWCLSRTTLPGRRLLAVLLAGPLLLPPFLGAIGVSTTLQPWLEAVGVSGGALQAWASVACFSLLLFPVVALLGARAMSAVPAGPVEAALLLGGRSAAFARVVLPSVLPSVLCAAAIVFVIALSDFAVPDLIGVFVAPVPIHVFSTEIFLQWSKYGNTARAVATGAPFVAATLALLAVAALLAARRPAAFVGSAHRSRAPVRLGPVTATLAWAFLAALLFASLALPVKVLVSWGFSPTRTPATIAEMPRVGEETLRWLRIGIAAAALSTFTATVLARWALRAGRGVRVGVSLVGALPLAVPAMALAAGTQHLRVEVPWLSQRFLTPVLAMTARFLPYALAAAWLAMREADPALEEPARLLGAPPAVRAWRVWGPLARRGIVASALLVLVFSLRELDVTVLVEAEVLPNRIYNELHFSRTGRVADLSMAYLAIVMVPALAAAWWLGRRRREGPRAEGGERTARQDVQ